MTFFNYLKSKRDKHIKCMYEKHIEALRKEASQLITIRNVEFDDNKIRPCIVINDIVSYIQYEDDCTDLMCMMLHLRETYVKMFQSMPTIKAL